MSDHAMTDDELFADLSRRLRDAHRAVAALDAPDEVRSATARRLIAITDASKHDLRRASERLDLLMAELGAAATPDGGPA